MGGRRARYNTRVAKRICEHIALGSTVKQALEREPLAPSVPLFWRWLDEYPEFRDMYERARTLQADLAADAIMSMASEVLKNPKFAAAYKVASDILRWHAEVNNRQRYGSKVQVEHKQAQLDPSKLRTEIAQLERELGLLEMTPATPLASGDVVDVEVKETT